VVVEEEEPTVQPTDVPPGVLVRVVMADAPNMVIVYGQSRRGAWKASGKGVAQMLGRTLSPSTSVLNSGV
jgi:hypothetical protein